MSTFVVNKPVKLSSAKDALRGLIPPDTIRAGGRYKNLPGIMLASRLAQLKRIGRWEGRPPKILEAVSPAPDPADNYVRLRLPSTFAPHHVRMLRASLGWIPVRGTFGAGHTLTLMPDDSISGSLTADRRRKIRRFGYFADEPTDIAIAA